MNCNWVLATGRVSIEPELWREYQCGNPAVVESQITHRCYCQEHYDRFYSGNVPFIFLEDQEPPE